MIYVDTWSNKLWWCNLISFYFHYNDLLHAPHSDTTRIVRDNHARHYALRTTHVLTLQLLLYDSTRPQANSMRSSRGLLLPGTIRV